MNQNSLKKVISDALVSGNFPAAEKMAADEIRRNKTDAQSWLFLTQALTFQGYGKSAAKTMERAWLLDPQAVWVPRVKVDLEKENRGLERDGIDELLKVKDVTVCAAMIVRDEEGYLSECLSRLISAVDEIVIVDTGSTDKTIEIAKSFDNVTVVEFQWCDDFSAARNAAFPHIKSDWVIWVDADEYLLEEDKHCIRNAAGIFDEFAIPVLLRVGIVNEYDNETSKTNYDTIRMFPLKYGLRFTSKIHEQIIVNDEKMLMNGRTASNAVRIRLRHFGYMASEIEKKGKLGRNIRLLMEMIEEDETNPLWYCFAGRELFAAGDLNQAAKYLSKCIRLSKNEHSFGRVLEAYTLLIRVYFEMDKFDLAETICLEAMKIRNDFPDLQYLYGLIQFKKANQYYKMAEEYVILSKKAFNTYRDIESPDCTILDWKADLLHADIALFVSKLSDARVLYEKAYDASSGMIREKILRKLNYIENERKKLSDLLDDEPSTKAR